MRGGLFVRGEGGGEFGLFETEIAQVRGDARGQLRRGGLAFRAELRAGVEQRFARGFDFLFQPRQLLAARLDLAQPLRRGVAKRDDLRDAAAVFALQRFDERHALLHLREPLGIEIHFLRVVLERTREIIQLRGRAQVRLAEPRCRRIDALQLAHELSDFAEPREHRVVGLAKPPDDLRGKLQQPPAV